MIDDGRCSMNDVVCGGCGSMWLGEKFSRFVDKLLLWQQAVVKAKKAAGACTSPTFLNKLKILSHFIWFSEF